MTSISNVDDRILDAARDCVEAFGIRRTTLTDVARRADVSRPTVYRRWPDVTSLVADLLTREGQKIFTECALAAPADNGRLRVVRTSAGVAVALLVHPLFNRIVDNEPELLATYTFQRLGTSQYAALELLEPEIAAGQRAGEIRSGDPAVLARTVLITVQAFVVSRRLTADVLSGAAVTEELAELLDRYLRPEGAGQ